MSSIPTRAHLVRALKAAANPERAAFMARYFKTGKGEYGAIEHFPPDQRSRVLAGNFTYPRSRAVSRSGRERYLGS